jgi:hypothetical protein
MTVAKANTTKATTTSKGDVDMAKLVGNFEQGLAAKAVTAQADNGVNPLDLLDGNSRGVLVLFPWQPKTIEKDKEYPVMKGHIDTKQVKIKVSAFMKTTDEGRVYLNLSIGSKGQERIGGALFRYETQDQTNGKWVAVPGKDNERFGVIAKSIKIGEGEYADVFTLRFYGNRKLSDGNVPYIKAKIYPERKEGQADADMSGCF